MTRESFAVPEAEMIPTAIKIIDPKTTKFGIPMYLLIQLNIRLTGS